MLHQDGSTHEWVPAQHWDLIITLDDATSEHYSMFFVEEEGTASSFQGMGEVIEGWGLPSSLYTDRGSHYWHTPEAGGKVDRERRTQFGRAMRQLGVEMIPAYSPEARGRCERMFATHQERLPKELAAHGIDTIPGANRYLAEHYRGAFNEEFAVPAAESGTAFVPFIGPGLADIVCEHYERTVGRDNCVSFEGKRLQIPAQTHRCHFIKVRVRVHRLELPRFSGHLQTVQRRCSQWQRLIRRMRRSSGDRWSSWSGRAVRQGNWPESSGVVPRPSVTGYVRVIAMKDVVMTD